MLPARLPAVRQPQVPDQHIAAGAVRFDEKNSATASRLIKEAVEDGQIVPVDEDAAKKLMKYTPSWAEAIEPEKG